MLSKHVHTPRLKRSVLALLGACSAFPALADETGGAVPELAPVTVSEQAYNSDTTVVVGSERLVERAAQDTRDILQNEIGVTVGGGGSALNQKIYIRGIEDTLLTLTVDGVPRGGNIFHHQGRVLIDPGIVKQIELDKGGTAASVGPGGLAGSVRITTKDAQDMLRPGQTLGGMVHGGLSSNEGHRSGGAIYGQITPELDFMVYGTFNKTEDYKDGKGNTQTNSGSEQTSGLAKLNWRLAPGHKVSLGYQSLKDEGVRYLRPHLAMSPSNNVPVPQEFDQETLTVGYSYDGGNGLPAIDLTFFADETTNRRTNGSAVFAKPIGYRYGERIDASGVNLLLKSKIGESTLRYGLNHHRRDAEAINPVKQGVGGNSVREDSTVTGLFAEGSVPLGDSLLLGVGARYDWYDYTDNHDQKFDSDGLSPSANLTWMVTGALSLRAGASHIVRGAGLKEAFMLDNGPGPFIYRNETDLKEEKAENLELGFNYESGPWTLKGSVFRLTIDDYIGLVFDTAARRDNLGEVKSTGYELGVGWRQGAFRSSLSVAHAKPKLNGYDLGDGDFSLGVSTGRTWIAGAGYTVAAWKADFAWNARFVESHDYTDGINLVEMRKPGYGIHDLYANWQPLGADRVRVTLSVRNLFDKFYYDQSTYGWSIAQGRYLGYAEPGRNVRLDLSWKF